MSLITIYDAGADSFGYLYLHSYASYSAGARGSAETELASRTSDIEYIGVRYYFIRNIVGSYSPENAVCWPEDYYNDLSDVPTTYRLTPTYSIHTSNLIGNYLVGEHTVTHRINSTTTQTWTDSTIEEDSNKNSFIRYS